MNVNDQLRAAGVRVTPLRQFVLEQLQRSDRPIRVVDLLAARPSHLTSSGATALGRAVQALVAVGLVEPHTGTSPGTFRLRAAPSA